MATATLRRPGGRTASCANVDPPHSMARVDFRARWFEPPLCVHPEPRESLVWSVLSAWT